MKWKLILFTLCISIALISSCRIRKNDIKLQYVTEPCLVPIKGNRFKLCDNMIVRINDEYHVIPNGFKTDLASIPRIMWSVFAPSDYDSIAAAVMHDWDYCCVPELTRKKADEIFYYGLRFHGASLIKAYVYYLGVRLIGGIYYTHGDNIATHAGEFDKKELQGIYEDVNNYGLG